MINMQDLYGRLQILRGRENTNCYLYSKNNEPPKEFKIPSTKINLLGIVSGGSSRSNTVEVNIETERKFNEILTFLKRYKL